MKNGGKNKSVAFIILVSVYCQIPLQACQRQANKWDKHLDVVMFELRTKRQILAILFNVWKRGPSEIG